MTDREGDLTGDEARRRLHEVTTRDAPLDERVDDVLSLGVEYLDVENGHVAEIDVESGHWETIASTDPPGGTVPENETRDLAQTYCRHTIRQEHPFARHDAAEQGMADDPAVEATDLSCYHGAAITVDRSIFGTVCFVASGPRAAPFTDEEKLFVDLAATLLGHAIQRERHDRHLAEQRRELDRREEQFRSLIDASFDVVFRLDRAGTVTYVSESDREVLGYPSEELVGTNYSELMATQDSFEQASNALARVLDGEPIEEGSLEVLDRDGGTVVMDIRAAPIYEVSTGRHDAWTADDRFLDGPARDARRGAGTTGAQRDSDAAVDQRDGAPAGDDRGDAPADDVAAVHVVLRDASQRMRYEHLVSVLQRVLRHNVRNALNVIHGSTDELESAIAGDAEATEFDALATIRGACADLHALSEKAGQLEAAVSETEEPTAVDLAQVVGRVAAQVGEQFPDATIDVTVDEPAYARATYGFERALAEVVENAAKHAGAEPTVAVRVRAVDDEVRVEVEDDGPGLPDQEHGVLTSGEESPLEHGSGLGHWFVYWIVTGLNGTVEASSTASGTVVTIHVPSASPEDPSDTLLDSA